jgi:GH15 family glucan-1,4-alpha-glucosidase
MRMDRYPPIADHGLVGDLQTSALVSAKGVVDWFAAPRFDSPSVFAALLDHDDGGYFRLAPDHPEGTWKQLYYPDTAVLVTRFMSPDGVGEVIDWMPPNTSRTPTDRHTLVRAVRDLGFVEEATDFTHWLGDRLHDQEGKNGESLQIMYRVDGEPLLNEETLDHWEGYRGSSPVRLGNAASDQLQLDIYGEALYGLSSGMDVGLQAGYSGWKSLSRTLDWLADSWDRPDEGIWETRGGRKDFTYSRVMCWAAFDRGLQLAEEYRRPADTVKWTEARDAILEQVVDKGWSEKEHAYVQHYGGDDVLDASLLLIPRVGFLAPKDPSWLSTLDGMERTLVSDSLVYRYDPAASPDGLRGSEGTFSLCTFLYVDALARSGRLREARYTFEKMHTYANHVGLFAEEVGPSGEQLGNFPQAFTHLSLIMAASTLDKALNNLPVSV